jgi:ATP-dependent Clp protease ATP-binding subunit ClpA
MFERFTDRARQVVVVAQEESARLSHNHIGTEHILLGILGAGPSVAVSALESLGISQAAVRQQVEDIVGPGPQQPSGHIPFTPRAKKALELSFREAIHLGHNYIGTEHILLGLIREGDGVGAQVLTRLGADLGRTRQQVIAALEPEPEPGPRPTPGPGPGGQQEPRPQPEPGSLLEPEQLLEPEPGPQPTPGPGGQQEPRPQPTPGPGGQQEPRPQPEPGSLLEPEQLLEPGPGPLPEPHRLRQLDREISQIRAAKEAAIDTQDFERAVTLRNQERELLVQRDAEQRQWLAAAEQRQSAGTAAAELDRLRAVVASLQAQLRSHGIEPVAGPPAADC